MQVIYKRMSPGRPRAAGFFAFFVVTLLEGETFRDVVFG